MKPFTDAFCMIPIIKMLKNSFRIRSPIYRHLTRRNVAEARNLAYLPKPLNAVLRTEEEVLEVSRLLQKLKLRAAYDYPKKVWGGYRMFAIVIRFGDVFSRILDAGSGPYSNVLDWLSLYGFQNLYACDILLKKEKALDNINYYRQDITKTRFPSSFFDFIICQSVIEHGVDVASFFKECYRLLKPEGFLLISTDFWSSPVDTSEIMLYGRPWRIFHPAEIDLLIKQAESEGLRLQEPMEYERLQQPVVSNQGKRYTFLFFVLRSWHQSIGHWKRPIFETTHSTSVLTPCLTVVLGRQPKIFSA